MKKLRETAVRKLKPLPSEPECLPFLLPFTPVLHAPRHVAMPAYHKIASWETVKSEENMFHKGAQTTHNAFFIALISPIGYGSPIEKIWAAFSNYIDLLQTSLRCKQLQ